MRIADITCDSDIKQFLNLTQLEEIISDINENNIAKLREESLNPLLEEIKSGGLDEYSLNIGGNPILHEKAVIIGKGLDATFDELTSTKNIILSAGKKHSIEELNTYISKLNEKIAKLNNKIIECETKNASESVCVNFDLSDYNNTLNTRNELLTKNAFYKDKLAIAKKLLNQAQQYVGNDYNFKDSQQ